MCHLQTEAGCRILMSAILLHVVSNLSGEDIDVSGIQNLGIPDARHKIGIRKLWSCRLPDCQISEGHHL